MPTAPDDTGLEAAVARLEEREAGVSRLLWWVLGVAVTVGLATAAGAIGVFARTEAHEARLRMVETEVVGHGAKIARVDSLGADVQHIRDALDALRRSQEALMQRIDRMLERPR